jgi:hypothetical protein
VVVLETLLLLVRVDLKQQAFAAKEESHFGEAVGGLDLVRPGRNLLAELGATQVLQQEPGANDPAEFSEGLIKAITPAVTCVRRSSRTTTPTRTSLKSCSSRRASTGSAPQAVG